MWLQHVVYRGTDNVIQELYWMAADGWQVGPLGSTIIGGVLTLLSK